jgi:hypothetical protein
MGAAFWTGGTVRIRKYLHTFFGKNKIKATASSFLPLFDPANAYTISEALVGMDLPPRGDPNYGAKLQQRFVLLFDKMSEADRDDGTTTHDAIKQAVFDVLTKAKNTPQATVEPIKFYVSHQVAAGPYSPANPQFRFVQWEENDDNGQAWFNFLLICPELPGPIAARLKKAVARKYAAKAGSASKAKKTKKKKARK